MPLASPAFERMHRTVLRTFGQAGTLDGVDLVVVMDHIWRPPEIGHLRTSIVEPSCYVMASDSPALGRKAALETRGRTYDVVAVERLEHHAMLRLVLRPRLEGEIHA